MNRVATIEAQVQQVVDTGRKPDGSPAGDLQALELSLRNTLTEHWAYQQAQARAHALGKLSTDEARLIYAALGEAPGPDGWAAGTTLARKVAVTTMLGGVIR